MFYHKGFNNSQLTFFRSHAAAARISGLELDGPGSYVMHVIGLMVLFAAALARRGSTHIALDIGGCGSFAVVRIL
jgi:hypothetical protein